MQIKLVADALRCLIRTELEMWWHKERPLYEVLNSVKVPGRPIRRYSPEQICHALDVACMLYFKVVLCLQHSVAVTMLLRRYGFSPELVIGTRVALSKFHAWVELDGRIVNDKPYTARLYRELARC